MRAFVVCVGLGAASVVSGPAWAEDCRLDQVELRGDFGSARFTVEIADDADERAQGLMFREHLSPSQGMLFVYESVGAPNFWMKNTLIPLDMLFVTPEGVVQAVHEMAVPGDLTPIGGGDGVLAVLEIKGGLAGAIGIGPGDEMRHPAFGRQAVWPCESE